MISRRRSVQIADRIVDAAYGPASANLHVWHHSFAHDLLARHTGEALSDDFDYGKVLETIAIRGLRQSPKLHNVMPSLEVGRLLGQRLFVRAANERSEPLDEAFEMSASRLQQVTLGGTTSYVRNMMRRASVMGRVERPSDRLNNSPPDQGADQYFTQAYQSIHEAELDANPDPGLPAIIDLLGESVLQAVTPTLNREVLAFDAAISDVRAHVLPTAV